MYSLTQGLHRAVINQVELVLCREVDTEISDTDTGTMVARFLMASFFLLSLTSGVSSQRIVLDPFDKSLTESACQGSRYVIAGERIVLIALLNNSDTNTSSWPLTNIILKSYYGVEVTGCRINIEADGCYGYKADLCGYCSRREDTAYHLVFNFTTEVFKSQYFYVTWVGSSSNISSSDVYVPITGDPYATTWVTYQRGYTAQDITRQTLVPSWNSTSVRTSLSNTQPGEPATWGYAGRPLNQTSFYSSIDYDVTDWNDQLDHQVNINYHDVCNRTWLLSVPVTDLPQLDCDLPVMTRSNSTGTQIEHTCRFSSFQPPEYTSCQIYAPGVPYPSQVVVRKSDSVVCVFNISDVQVGGLTRVDMYFSVRFLLDVQFTNGTSQAPKVVRFHVNGSRSVTVDRGSDVTLECKVYGNPMAEAVIVGTGTGRIREQRETTNLLQLTLTDIQCNDTGRYTCHGVNSFGTTPSELRGYLDLNVRCPIQIESYVPNNKDSMIHYGDEADPLMTFKVYGYPPPDHFGLQLQQGTTLVNVSREFYWCTYSSLNPSLGLVTLLMSRGQTTTGQAYMLTVSNGNPDSLQFRFQLAARAPDVTDAGSGNTASAWRAAFIAVTCVCAVVILSIIVVVIVIYLRRKRHSCQATSNTSTRPSPGGRGKQHSARGLGERSDPGYDYPVPDNATAGPYQQPSPAAPSNGILYQNSEGEEDVYENAAFDNVYELTEQA